MRILFAPPLFASFMLFAPPACGVASAAPAATSLAAVETPSVQAAQLYERDWQWQLRHAPEKATALGEHRYNAWLSDTSLAGRAAALAHERAMLAAARKIDRAQLAGEEQVSYDLFVADKERLVAAGASTPFDPLPITAYDGLQVRLPRLVAQMPFTNDADYLTYLARLQALPAHVDGLLEQLRAGTQAGWTIPKAAIAAVPDALRALREQLADGPLGAPFQRIPATIAPEVRAQLRAAGKAALGGQVTPSLRRLEDYLRQDYLPAARASIGAAALPGGAEWYAQLVKNSTTTAMTPAQVHALGQQEVARLRAEIESLIPRTGFRGGFAEFIVFARSDRRLFFSDPAALLDRYRRTLALAQARLGRVVTLTPAAGIVVKPMGGDSGGQPAAYYEAGSAARTAALVVDTARLNARPIWQVDTVALHEAVPGHHLQVARAQELALPAFRRHGWYDAFGEGWATYAESLGPELGLFQDPFSQFGHLNEEMFRAARLVVDTGIHALGWSRQQAIDYLNTHTANPPPDNEAEVDRYIARPAQALGYQVGQLRIVALRTQARAALGKQFDLRRFHDALLGGGALPLSELERRMGRWIAAEKDPATRAGELQANAGGADAAFNAEFASAPVSTWEPAFEFDFALDGELEPGYDPGPSPDFAPPAPPAPPPARKSFRAPSWIE